MPLQSQSGIEGQKIPGEVLAFILCLRKLEVEVRDGQLGRSEGGQAKAVLLLPGISV